VRSKDPDIKHLFEPRGVAVIGASQNPNKLGYWVVQNIVEGGYAGKVFPINPKGGGLFGHRVYERLEEVNDSVDVACVVVPAVRVFEAVQSCAHRGVKFAVIISSGFSEVGNTTEERKIVSYARDHRMRVIGPNVFGLYSAPASLNATFGPQEVKPGGVAIISQSGAIGLAMMGKTKIENIGLSAMVSVGNKSDVDESDLLGYLSTLDDAKVVLMYVEGITAGERLIQVLREATQTKPVIVIKSGRSQRGAAAAASHTGSLAGEDKVFDEVIRQCGVIRAESLQEAMNWCRFLAEAPPLEGENNVIVTNGGGLGVLAADACEKYSVSLYDDLQDLKKTFSDTMPEFGSTKNPVDLTGQAAAGNYSQALEAALKNEDIHSVECLVCETATVEPEAFTEFVKQTYARYKTRKPLVLSLFGGSKTEKCMAWLQQDNIPVFRDVYDATSYMGAMFAHYRNKAYPRGEVAKVTIDSEALQQVIAEARQDGRTFLLTHEAHRVMKAAGVATPKSYIARSLDEAVSHAEDIGYPVVMKVVSRDIVHKSDVGGVALDLENKDEVMDAYEAILHNCRANRPGATIEGIEVTEMIQSAVETIVGARVDASFGPIVMFGLGGIYVEVMKDISFRAFPMSREEAMNMIAEIHSYPLLLGVRGEERKDIEALTDAIIRVGTVLRQCKDITDIEINPLVVYDQGEGVRAVDVRILISRPEEAA
jgi:acetyltransferase